jgi:urea transport system ATP-binding protein
MTPVIELDRIEAAIGGSRILRGVSFVIPEKSVFCLMGRNGVGKTSTLRAITGLLPTQGGSITFLGGSFNGLRPEARARRGLGFVPQGRDIFPHLTVEENLLIGAIARGKKLKGELDRVYSLFPILKEFLPRKGGMLSGGQQQQLAIGRALLTEPKLLILDEPTEGIQPNIIDQIGEAIKLLRRGGHPNEVGLLGDVAIHLRKLRRDGQHPSLEMIDATAEVVNRLRRDGVHSSPELLGVAADNLSRIRLNGPSDGLALADEIGYALKQLRSEGQMSILLVEQYLDFCRELGDSYAILERGAVASAGPMSDLSDEIVKKFLTV